MHSRHTPSRLHKTLSVKYVLGNNYCLFWKSTSHTYTLCWQVAYLMLNFMEQCIKIPPGLTGYVINTNDPLSRHGWFQDGEYIHTCNHILYFATRSYVRKYLAVTHQQLQIFESTTTEWVILNKQSFRNWTPCENNHSSKASRYPKRRDY
jgi:hypothetical protein